MNEYINNDNGTVSLDENVVAQVAGMTALDCFGIVGMGIVSVKDGIVKQLKETISRREFMLRLMRMEILW